MPNHTCACSVRGTAPRGLGEEEHSPPQRDHGAAPKAAGHEVRRPHRRCTATASQGSRQFSLL